MRVLGIDPGLAIVGYGIIDDGDNKLEVVDYGVLTTSAGMEMPARLVIIYNSVDKLIDKYKPDAIAYEELFFNKNAKTALSVGQARGVAVLAGALKGIELFEYTPLQVKQAVVGYGRADKKQVQFMAKTLLGLKEIPKPDDAADALAVAICQINSSRMSRNFGTGYDTKSTSRYEF